MIVIDSSCWLEFLAGSETGKKIKPLVSNYDSLLVPVITIYEVYKKLLAETNEETAKDIACMMQQGRVIELSSDLAMLAAENSRQFKLPMADAIIYATAMKYGCQLYTQDDHFKNLKNVTYFHKSK